MNTLRRRGKATHILNLSTRWK